MILFFTEALLRNSARKPHQVGDKAPPAEINSTAVAVVVVVVVV